MVITAATGVTILTLPLPPPGVTGSGSVVACMAVGAWCMSEKRHSGRTLAGESGISYYAGQRISPVPSESTPPAAAVAARLAPGRPPGLFRERFGGQLRPERDRVGL